MSAHVLLILLNELGKRKQCEACQTFNHFFATSFINQYKSTNVRFYLSYDITITLKSPFWRKNIILSLCKQRCYGRHNVSRKSVTHYRIKDLFFYALSSAGSRKWC